MLIVVGGHSRNIGKTSVVAGLICAFPDRNWTAMKITQFGHGVCSAAGEPCGCAVEPEHPCAITEERDVRTGTDTARFLAAGALRSFWVRTPVGQLGNAVPHIRKIIQSGENTVAESNSLLQFFKPDLYLVVLDFNTADFKDSSLRYLDRADALIVVGGQATEPTWNGVSRRLWQAKPRFFVRPPQYITTEIAAFVRGRLAPVAR